MSGNEVNFNGKGTSPFVDHNKELAKIITQKLRSKSSITTADFPSYPVVGQSSGNINTSQITDSRSPKSLEKEFKEFQAGSSLREKNEDFVYTTHHFRIEIERLHDKNNKLENTLNQKDNEIERLNSIVKDLQSKQLFNIQAVEELRSELIQKDLKNKPQPSPSASCNGDKRSNGRRHSSISTAYNSRNTTPKKVDVAAREMTGKYSGIFLIPEHVIFIQRNSDDMGKQELCMPFLSRINHNWMSSLRSEPPTPMKTRSKTLKDENKKPVALYFSPSVREFSYEEKK